MLVSGAHAEAAGRPDAMVTVLVAVAVAISVGVLTYVLATGRERSARWRERTIAEHGQAGYVRRRRAWLLATWGPVTAALCVAFAARLWSH